MRYESNINMRKRKGGQPLLIVGPLHLPHVDQILGQGHGLAVPGDGDRPVQVGGSVSVLAVGDADHGPADLPGNDRTLSPIYYYRHRDSPSVILIERRWTFR